MTTAPPDIHHRPRLGVDRVQMGSNRWSLLVRGPGRSRRPVDLVTTVSFAVGGLLLVWSAYIHFHLWDETGGYRSIATIGPLFLFQSIAGLVVGLGVVAVRRVWAAVVGVAFALSTLGGFLISVTHGLFGFQETWLAPFAQQAFGIEVAAVVVLCLAAVLCLVGSTPRTRGGATPAPPAT